jgi:predicted RNA-binding protein with PIN domain
MYLIDGHNLIGQLPDISLKDPDDEAKLVLKLRQFSAQTGKKCQVIFDHGLPAGKSKLSNSAVTVVFAARPGEADDVMLRRIRDARDVKRWTVVSSDERVLSVARERGMKVQRSQEFARQLANVARAIPKDEHPNPHIPASEVEEWLRLFGGEDTDG